MEVGEGGGRLYIYRHTVTTRMTYALRWAAMRAILLEATGWQWEITGSQGEATCSGRAITTTRRVVICTQKNWGFHGGYYLHTSKHALQK